MTGASMAYSAYLIGSPDVELSVKGGTITLDEGQAPHVQGSIDVDVTDETTRTALDPRLNARVRIEVDGVYPSFSVHREFNLGLRKRPLQQSTDTLTLSLASDEALLIDYATMADDATPYTLASSLRSIVNYVLNGAISGAALAASPTLDANLTPLWSVTNLNVNPSAVGTSNWFGVNATIANQTGAGAQGNGFQRCTLSATSAQIWASGSNSYTGGPQIRPGQPHTWSVYARNPGSGSPQVGARIAWWDANGGLLRIDGTGTTALTGSFQRFSVTTLVPPPMAVRASGYLQVSGASTNIVDVDGAMLAEGRFLPPYFDGGTTTTTTYQYAWTGTANASTSTRTLLIDGLDPDALVWKAGQAAIDFLLPLVQAQGYRLVCDEARSWTLRDEDYAADGSVYAAYGVNLVDGSDTIDRDSGLWFDAQVTRYTWTDGAGAEQTRTDPFALNTPPARVNLVEIDGAYPGPGRSEYAVRRAQGRGREVTVTTMSDWRADAEQAFTADLNGAPIQIGQISSVEFDLSTDEMTVVSRTTDTPPNAWALGPDTKTWAGMSATPTWTTFDWSAA